MKTHKLLITAILLLGLNLNSNAQTQKGNDIEGEMYYDESGGSVSMPDANTIAIGAQNNTGSEAQAGHVRIYIWNGTDWVQKGNDIDGEAAFDLSGCSVSMPDAITVAIGAAQNDRNKSDGDEGGHVRIYAWNGSAWIQKGNDIDGEEDLNGAGFSVCMPDANTVAIGAPANDGNGFNAGHVRIYGWNGSKWVQKGNDIDGEAVGDESGHSVSMPDANTVAIGATHNSGSADSSGHVRIYSWNNSVWVQKGKDIDGALAFDFSGWSLCMPDSNTVAIGSPAPRIPSIRAGHVCVYSWNGSQWVQKGIDIKGEAVGDNFGWSVSMPDANTIAIGAPWHQRSGFTSGHVRMYTWNGSNWIKKGIDIDGELDYELSGFSISMPDTKTVAIGTPHNDGNGSDAGHVRIYTLNFVSIQQDDIEDILTNYPNPTDENLNIDLGNTFSEIRVIVRNSLGQEVKRLLVRKSDKIRLTIEGEAGVYLIEVNADNKRAFLKVIKE